MTPRQTRHSLSGDVSVTPRESSKDWRRNNCRVLPTRRAGADGTRSVPATFLATVISAPVLSLSGISRQRCGYSMPRFPSPGSLRVKFPGFIGTIKALRLPAGHLAALRFLRLAILRDHAFFAPVVAACGDDGPGVGHSVSPPEFSSVVPGEPRFPFAHVLRPRPTDTFLTDYGTLAWPPLSGRRRRRQEKNFEAQWHGFRARHLRITMLVTRHRARLASRCLSGSPGRAFTRRAPIKGFQLTSLFVVLPFQASWHNHLFSSTFSPPKNSPTNRPTISRNLHPVEALSKNGKNVMPY